VTPRGWAVAALGLAALASLGWRWTGAVANDGASVAAASAPGAAHSGVDVPARLAASTPDRPPQAPPSAQQQAQRALWQARLQRAHQVLNAYRLATRYPHHSRPLTEQPDQIHPNQPIVEDRPLSLPGEPVKAGVFLRTTQDKVHLQGDESVTVSVSAHDGEGRPLPLQVTRAVAHEGAIGAAVSNWPSIPVAFSDDGQGADTLADDGVFSARLLPSRQGFGQRAGVIRIEALLRSGEQPGFVYFDVIYSPESPAAWSGAVHEALHQGSLDLYLPVQVNQAGRYVVSGRIDDAAGRPLALLSFNDEVQAGAQEFRLQLFGKLVRDLQPSFPLRLRDVEAFLLKPDTFPDRALLPRRPGLVYTTQRRPLVAFSDAEWASEERTRYLTEFEKDLQQAQDQVDRLAPASP
jgi:hypothetical protein